MQPLLLVEPEEVRTRRRGTEGADGGRRVEARGVVAGPEQRRQTTLELDAGHQRGEKVRAASTLLLDEGEERGNDRCRGVAAHQRMRVVEIEGVSRRTVDKRRRLPRCALATADQRRRPVARGDGLDQDLGQRLARAGERTAEEVEQAMAGHLERVGRNLLIPDAADGAHERERGTHGHRRAISCRTGRT